MELKAPGLIPITSFLVLQESRKIELQPLVGKQPKLLTWFLYRHLSPTQPRALSPLHRSQQTLPLFTSSLKPRKALML